MRLFYKIALVLVAAATVPLATVGFALVARNQRALESEVRARFDETARHAAEAVAADVEGRARQLARRFAEAQQPAGPSPQCEVAWRRSPASRSRVLISTRLLPGKCFPSV